MADGVTSLIGGHNGTFYRDVSPGQYTVTIDSYLSGYFNQFADITLTAGQEAYIKVLSQGQRVGGERGGRENFYTQVVPAEAARADAARRPFYGGG